MGDDRHLQVLAERPHRVVALGRGRASGASTSPGSSPRRAPTSLARRISASTLSSSTGDRNERHAAAALGAVRAELGQPAVVGLGAGHAELGVEVAATGRGRRRTARRCGSRPRRRRGRRPRPPRRRASSAWSRSMASQPPASSSSCSSNHFFANSSSRTPSFVIASQHGGALARGTRRTAGGTSARGSRGTARSAGRRGCRRR